MNVFIIGSGNIAFHLSKALLKNGIGISGICSRNKSEGKTIAKMVKSSWYEQIKYIPQDVDIYLLCVSDDAIQTVAEQLPKSVRKTKIVAHTSGSKSIESTLISFKNAGVFYPLQTFTKGKRLRYKNIPFCINGTNKKTIKTLKILAKSISESVQYITDEQRKRIHLSAVIINNFVNHLILMSERLLTEEKISTDILQPLLLETIRKQKSLGPFDAQTGPARRMDSKTIEDHLAILQGHEEFKTIYKSISKSIQKTYKAEQ